MINEKIINGFPNYSIDISGNVKNIARGKTLAPHINNKGYVNVTLYKNNTDHKKKVHRLIAEHFIDNPLNLETVNHKDGNKQNNNFSNLEWASYSENNSHALVTKLRTPKRTLDDESIYEILTSDLKSKFLAEKFGMSTSHINSIRRGEFIEYFKMHSDLWQKYLELKKGNLV